MTTENSHEATGESNVALVAYLILAHEDPEMLARLISALDHERARFFVHVDAKSDVEQFRKTVGDQRHVTFLANRIKVYWGGFSQVEATLWLMDAAINALDNFSYAVVLSGVHYPIKSNSFIMAMLQDPGPEYLQYATVSEVGSEFKTSVFCLFDHPLFNPRTRFFRNSAFNRLARGPGKLANLIFRTLLPLVYKRTPPGNILPYTGANWLTITRPCVQYVLEYVNKNSQFKKYFHYVVQPDESFFHTIICNSHFRTANQDVTLGNLRGDDAPAGKYSSLRGLSLTYAKCSPNGVPKVLDENEFPDIRKELNFFGFPQLFARKFDIERSSKLLDMIDELRNGQ